MSSLTILGDTSGSIVLQAPAVSGSTTLTLPATSGTVITTASSGTILQVVNSSASTVITSSGGAVAVVLNPSITPKFSNSKILVMTSVCVTWVTSSNAYTGAFLYRGTTSGTLLSDLYQAIGSAVNGYAAYAHNYLDSPATTSATTYTLAINRASSGTTSVSTNSTYSMTLMEIAG